MTNRLTLVCHASTRDLRAATFGGDDALDAAGLAAAARAGTRLAAADRCWASPALRARQTAKALGLAPQIVASLRDCDYGRWTGLTFRQVLLHEPRKLVGWISRPETSPHGGETISQLIDRVAAWMGGLVPLRGHVVAVTHAAVIRAAIVHVIGAGLPSFWHVDVVPLAQVDMRSNGRRWVLRAIQPPLPPPGREDGDG